MRLRTLLSGVLATVPLSVASPVTAVAVAVETEGDVPDQAVETPRHCVVTAVRTPAGLVADDSTMVCYDTLAEAVRTRQNRSVITVATHYEHASGLGGDTYTIQSSSCATTWIPGPWWSTNVSATRLGVNCTGAKHYTLDTCSGSSQVVSAPNPTITNLNSTLNNNTRCVKYS